MYFFYLRFIRVFKFILCICILMSKVYWRSIHTHIINVSIYTLQLNSQLCCSFARARRLFYIYIKAYLCMHVLKMYLINNVRAFNLFFSDSLSRYLSCSLIWLLIRIKCKFIKGFYFQTSTSELKYKRGRGIAQWVRLG